MFHIDCDNCNSGEIGDEWYAEVAVQRAREEGYHLRNYTAICPECWDAGIRFTDLTA